MAITVLVVDDFEAVRQYKKESRHGIDDGTRDKADHRPALPVQCCAWLKRKYRGNDHHESDSCENKTEPEADLRLRETLSVVLQFLRCRNSEFLCCQPCFIGALKNRKSSMRLCR